MIEEVMKILYRYCEESRDTAKDPCLRDIAQQIDQLYKPKPDSRLLTDEEMTTINNNQPSEAKYGDVFKAIAKAQRDLTARDMRAECLDRVGRIFKEIENTGWYNKLPYVRASVQALKEEVNL